MRELAGKVAVVTGAASGIGRALVELLAGRGCQLALVDVSRAGLDAAADSATARGCKVSVHVVDVSHREAMRALPDAVLAAHGQVDLLINNAGVATGRLFAEQSIESFERIIDVNFKGVAYGCRFFLPHLLARPEAQIVNISSMFGFIGVPHNAAYCASKFAVRGLSESLWAELSRTPVRVLCVHPGGVRTNIVRSGSEWPGGTESAAARFDMIALTHPERAARRIVRAIERGKRRLRVGPDAYVVDWLTRLFPTIARLLPPSSET